MAQGQMKRSMGQKCLETDLTTERQLIFDKDKKAMREKGFLLYKILENAKYSYSDTKHTGGKGRQGGKDGL